MIILIDYTDNDPGGEIPKERAGMLVASFRGLSFKILESLRVFSAPPPPPLVCYAAVFSVVTQRSSPLVGVSGEERCVATLKTAV